MRAPADPSRRVVRSAIDRAQRSAYLEGHLNIQAARLFSTGGGRDFLDYLRSITTSRICEPDVTDHELRHLEGARWLFGVIQARVKAGQKDGAPDVPERPDEDPARG